MLKAVCAPYTLQFKKPSGTSRGILTDKLSWFIKVWDDANPTVFGIGECGLLKGLSIDDRPNYAEKVQEVCDEIESLQHVYHDELIDWPSIRFGVEMALLDLKNGGQKVFFDSPFIQNQHQMPINGLIWMGEESFLRSQIQEKIAAGFSCIKMKIGAINFEQEFDVLKDLRKEFGPDQIELRLDANGAFEPHLAIQKLERLSRLFLHSIEQPIMANQHDQMAAVCALANVPIALDEELIGVHQLKDKQALLEKIQPRYIILKASLLGGFKACQEWIDIAESMNIGWWTTSALESNIGLNAITQWTYNLNNPVVHGLGTGSLYTNNFESPLYIAEGKIGYNPSTQWKTDGLQFNH